MSWALMCPVHIYYPSLTDWSFTFSISMTSCIVWILIMGFTYMHVIVYRHIRIRPVTGNTVWKLSNVSVLHSNKKVLSYNTHQIQSVSFTMEVGHNYKTSVFTIEKVPYASKFSWISVQQSLDYPNTCVLLQCQINKFVWIIE